MTADYEYKTESAEAMLQITFCQIMLKNLLYKFKTDSEYFYKNTHFLIKTTSVYKNVNTNQNKIRTANSTPPLPQHLLPRI